ncbi:hypothetical protein AVEN_104444-1 [Araneus ventricosus]|uniref:Uncharacterized protein n=1 Tax=Araneus ventricosus TaxID=182803 RepID=A0A4Y2VZ28_ARAVE|nr:hypothetical protein AVEN_104444-1 [Araneus ventricosus]
MYEEMATLLCKCESVVNGRPLTCLYDDPNESRAIKPSDFTQDIKGNETVDLDIVDANKFVTYRTYIVNYAYDPKRNIWQNLYEIQSYL